MKTYAETKLVEPFDWNEFLNQKTITDEEWMAAKVRANDWVTCACGNQCSIIPRYSGGRPVDEFLSELGDRFAAFIDMREIFSAQNCLKSIEQRSAQLIQKIKSEGGEA